MSIWGLSTKLFMSLSNPVEKIYKISKCTAQLEIVIVTPYKINIISLSGNCSAFTKKYDRRLPCNLSTDITLRIIDPKLTVISKRWQSKTHGYLKIMIENWWTEFCLLHFEANLCTFHQFDIDGYCLISSQQACS